VPLALLQARAGAGLAASAAAAAKAGSPPPPSLRAAASAALAAHAARPTPRPPHPAWVLVAPLAQAPVFITAMLAVRRLALAPDSPLRAGGALWCPDLTLSALELPTGLAPLGTPGLLLPALAAALLFANVQAAFGVLLAAQRGWPGAIKLGLEWMTLPALVAGLTLPHAVMAYWCVSITDESCALLTPAACLTAGCPPMPGRWCRARPCAARWRVA
jgi:hypothetical protein